MKIQVELGPMVESLKKQLCRSRIDGVSISILEADHDAINRLYVRQYVSDAAFLILQKKLLKKIQSFATAAANKEDGK